MFGSRSQLNIDFLSTLKGALTLVRDPEKTESVYDIEDGLRHTKATQAAIAFVKKNAEVASLIAERYLPPPLDLDALAQLPANSLGYTYAHYIRDAGFDPNFYRPIDVVDDVSYGEHPTFAKIRDVRQDRGVILGSLRNDPSNDPERD